MIEFKLSCTGGPSQGTDFPMKGEQIVLGRAADIGVSIPDTSVSRRHAELTRAADGWRAKDLGSGNGTLLNGEKLEGEQPIRNGDILVLGNTHLTFIDLTNTTDRAIVPVRTGPPAEPVPADMARRPTETRPAVRPRVSRHQAPAAGKAKVTLRVVVLGVVLVLAMAGVGLFIIKKLRDGKDKDAQKIAQQQQADRDRIVMVMQTGKNFVRDGKWKEALAKFEEVKAADPAFPELARYLEQAPKQIELEKKLEEAQVALKENKLGPASDALNQAAGLSVYSPRLQPLRQTLEGKLPGRLSEASAAFKASDPERARELLNDLLHATPDNQAAHDLLQQVERALELKNGKQHRVGQPHAEPRIWDATVQKYSSGDLAGALAAAKDCSSSPRCRAVGEFAELHKRLDDLDFRGLRRAIQLDREISGENHPTKLARPAGVKVANQLYKEAAAAKSRRDWAQAKKIAREVLDADPNHAGAAGIVAESGKKAKELYLFAYSNKETNPDEALRIFHQVVDMTPADDEFHVKSKMWIDKLSR